MPRVAALIAQRGVTGGVSQASSNLVLQGWQPGTDDDMITAVTLSQITDSGGFLCVVYDQISCWVDNSSRNARHSRLLNGRSPVTGVL